MADTIIDLASAKPDEFQSALDDWLRENAAELTACAPDESKSVEAATAAPRRFQRMLFDAGWLRAGWPESIGGVGGSAELRAQVYDTVTTAGYALPETLPTLEVMLPCLQKYAPHLAEEFGPAFLAGEELWTQGFSETEAGSDMAALRTRATPVEGGWRITGHKVWNSYAAVADRCMLLARTGEQSARHRAISMFFVDLDSPGVEVRPIRTMTGRNELAEIFLEDVFVPNDRLIGAENEGWAQSMYLLQWERGMYAWMRQAWLFTRLDALRAALEGTPYAREFAAAYIKVTSLRLISRGTLRRLANDENPGPEISVDKLLLSGAEQAVLNVARLLLRGEFEVGDSDEITHWTGDYFYTRSASIYGGAAEIQRDIIAQRVLGLPRGR